MSTDEIRLVIPAEEDFRPIAHLVTGGLASRLEVTYDELEDLQVALEALLGLRDDEGELSIVLSSEGGSLRAAVGPFDADLVRVDDSSDGLDLRRVLETVCDTHEVEQRGAETWVEVTKRIGAPAA